LKGHTNGTHTPKSVCECEDINAFCYQGVHTYREVMANRPDIIIKNKKEKKMHSGRCGNTIEWECHANGSSKETEIQEFMYWDTMNVESEMNGNASNNQSHQNRNKRFKEIFEGIPGKHSTDSP
jgi:hypothetical protein